MPKKPLEIATRLREKYAAPGTEIKSREEHKGIEKHARFTTKEGVIVDVINRLSRSVDREGGGGMVIGASAITLEFDRSSITLKKDGEHSIYFSDPTHITPHFAEVIQGCLAELENLD